LWELILAAHMLRRQPGDLLFTHWRRQAMATLRAAQLGARLALMFELMPHVGYFPDFLNPFEATRGLEHGLEAIRSTPKATLRRDLRQLACSRPLPPAAQRLAAGEPAALVELTDTMRACYNLTIQPEHRSVRTALDRDRHVRTDALADRGVHGLLNSLHPMVNWSSGELQVPGHRDQELHLNGRGLLLIPAYFCILTPVTMFDPALPPVLIYPVHRQPDVLPGSGDRAAHAALAALIGATRAAVLDAIATRTAITTTDLARRLAISPATASEHTTVLRDAGLITSHRDRNRMLHNVTPLGYALLES
jgi:DNA-binding transcriptional ArsR family regulator